ncbi:metallophosphoesterase [Vibrio barjaei]|uniref:metallophosphoesterase n=1 Tax=Vibrio barjaei TaxID=1676683 RepID=UPI0022844C0D|nr:metallophosphoesterase [Vibrio barjaei]MCY9870445.1 hypothetical protein [Vibrio barjaei]
MTAIPHRLIHRIFDKPIRWGLRGDPELWKHIAELTIEKAATNLTPHKSLTVGQIVKFTHDEFERVKNSATDQASPNSSWHPEFSTGGLSSGSISHNWWNWTGLPLIGERALELSRILNNNDSMYFVIGDVHGQSEKLTDLLTHYGFQPDRQDAANSQGTLIFVGDLIDCPESTTSNHYETLTIIKDLCDRGLAKCAMGNHEFNAIGWSLQKEDGTHCRPHTQANQKQHNAFLSQVPESERPKWINWFKSLPIFLDFGEMRIVHACWHQPTINRLKPYLDENNAIKEEHWFDAFNEEHELYRLLERTLKGPELALPNVVSYKDKHGTTRTNARVAWWRDKQDIKSFNDAIYNPTGEAIAKLDIPIDHIDIPFNKPQQIPVFVGHYTLSGKPNVLGNNVICVDYNAIKDDNSLVGYAIDLTDIVDSEDIIDNDNFRYIKTN